MSVCSAHPFLSPHKISHLMKLAVLISSSHAFFFLVLNTRTESPLLIILFSTSIYVRPLYVTLISVQGFYYWFSTISKTCIRHPESRFKRNNKLFIAKCVLCYEAQRRSHFIPHWCLFLLESQLGRLTCESYGLLHVRTGNTQEPIVRNPL